MSEANDFSENISELMKLLKKILKSQKGESQDLAGLLDKKNINLNLCFFTFLPVTPEELDDFEVELQNDIELDDEEAFSLELNNMDLDFLKKNGLKF